jgi:hypothetical protein
LQQINVRTFPVFAAVLISLAANAGPQLRRPMQAVTPERQVATTTVISHLKYCGGRVLSQAKIVPVLWGAAQSPVPPSATCSGAFIDCLDKWYADFVKSPQFGWLDEYQTTIPAPNGTAGTNQHILAPTVVKTIQITPANVKPVVGETEVENELVAQIQAGVLPAPDSATANASETIYEVHFPLTVDPSDPGNQACGAFCAYHDSWVSHILGKTTMISVIPSHMPPGYSGGRSCGAGCGESTDWFANLGGSISHETIEAITDPDVGAAFSGACAAPYGWVDNSATDSLSYHGEIGDICEGLPQVATSAQVTEITLGGSDLFQYTVQREWSNKFGACIVDAAESFKVSVPDSPVTVNVGTPVTVPVLVSLPSNGNMAIPVKLVARGLASSITATFSPSTIMAGQSSMMTLTIASGSSTTASTFGITAESGTEQAQTVVSLMAPEYSASLSTSSLALTAGGPAGTVILSTMVLSGQPRAFTVVGGGAAGVKLAETGGTVGTDLTLHFTAAAGAPSSHSTISVQIVSGGVTKSLPIQMTLTGDDATLTAPATVQGNPGGSVSFTVTTTTKSGNPQPLALSATDLPLGATAVFSPASITSGQTAMCTVTLASTQPLLPVDIKVIGKGSISTFPAGVTITVVAAPSGCAQTDALGFALLGLLAFAARKRSRAARV